MKAAIYLGQENVEVRELPILSVETMMLSSKIFIQVSVAQTLPFICTDREPGTG